MINKSNIVNSSWYKATSLIERDAALKASQSKTDISQFDIELSDQRWQRWREQRPFINNDIFTSRLVLSDISESDFRYQLGVPIKEVQSWFIETPVWLVNLLDSLSTMATVETCSVSPIVSEFILQSFFNI